MKSSDILVIGGGIVGCATAWQASKIFPDQKIILLDKEPKLASHQSGRNSGVLHAGIYYKPGSAKAKNCRAGKISMEAFCREHGIGFNTCGKLVIACNEVEVQELKNIRERASANGVGCTAIDAKGIKEIEPQASGLSALHVPSSGIIDFIDVVEKLVALLRSSGHQVLTSQKVIRIEESQNSVSVQTESETFLCGKLINCAGIHSDRIAALCGLKHDIKMIPFRGEYFELLPEAYYLCRGLIYPVPDPRYPFLGLHFTPRYKGGVLCGPNAVLAFGREAYNKSNINLSDLRETLTFKGFAPFAKKHWRAGLGELWRSWNKDLFVKSLQSLVPAVRKEHLRPARSGIRAQAMNSRGELVEDFVIERGLSSIHVLNAPSPAAASSLDIGLTVAKKLSD